MNKMGKRFVAWAIVFVSIMSFLPIKFGTNGQAAKAVTTEIKVSGTPTLAGDNITITNGEYSTQQPYNNFTLSVDYKIVKQENIKIGDTGVIDQEVIINSIDGIDITNLSTTDAAAKLATIGCSIGSGKDVITDDNNNKTVGVTITGLPYGVNTIGYQIKEITVFNKGKTTTETTYDNNNNPVVTTKTVDDWQLPEDNYYPSKNTAKQIVIQHANGFVQGKIDIMNFNSYVGDTMAVYNANKDLQDSKAPFLFSENAKAETSCPLRYNYDVSDAIQTLQYTMHFKGISVNNAEMVKNGVADNTIGIDSTKNTISGYLTNLGSSDLIVAKIRDTTNTNVIKAYAIQLKYTTLPTEKDYTLRDAGITKLNYDADSNIKAYVDKQFTVTKENGITTYSGTISIDKMAGMINIEPELGRDAADTAFKMTNHYDDGAGIEESKIINNKQYIDFAKGVNNNEIWLEVCQGKDGNITSAVPLAIYKLKVNLLGTTSSDVKFSFDNSILTQPGRSISEKIDFSTDRRTYDLYNDTNSVDVKLTSPQTAKNEYIRAWGGTSIQSDNVTEIKNLGNNNTVTIDTTNYKKILLQAYYDEIVYKKDGNGAFILDADGNKIIESKTQYAIGQKYTFYIAKNADVPDPTQDTKSSDASLSNITAANGNIKSTDGNSGFSSDKINYKVTVPKADISSEITVTASNSKVKDISATIVESGDQYGLNSGEPFGFPLSSNGTTNIKIVVTAEDGITSKTYNITVSNDTRSASALLKNVITDNGDFTFDADADPNKIRVDQNITKLEVSPVAEESNSKMTVNGEKFNGDPITIDLKGSQETDMKIKVTSEDGSESKTYNFEIYRTDAPIDNNDDNTNEDDVFYDDIDDCWVDTSKYEEWGIVKGKQVYFDNKGRQVKDQWVKTKDTWYYLNSKGYKTTGWRKETAGKSYYLDPTTGELKTGWMSLNNKWYYLGLNGVMQKGWLALNGKRYYFTPEGEMLINKSMYIDNKTYNFGPDGAAS